MTRQVVLYPDPILKQRSAEVGEVTDEVRALFHDMAETMEAAGGIGISAPQVGVLKRVVVVKAKASSSHDPVPIAFIDPVVTSTAGKEKAGEGCLSFPGVFEQVERATDVHVEYTDLQGERRGAILQGLEARCILHEIDHLDGRLFIERMSMARRALVDKAVRRLAR